MCKRKVRSGFRLHPRIDRTETSILIKFTINSAKKLVVEPQVTVGQSFCSAAFHDVSYVSVFTATELTALSFVFFFGEETARRGVEGEGKSCRPPCSTPHVPVLLASMSHCVLHFTCRIVSKKKKS